MSFPLKIIFLTFLLLVLFHWLTAGQDEILEGPPEKPSHVQLNQ